LSESITNGGGDASNWDNAGKISEGESEDDVWCWSVLAGFSKLEGWAVGVVGVVFSDESNDHTGPESEHDASICVHSVDEKWFSLGSSKEDEGFWENVYGWEDAEGHEDGGGTDLEFKDTLDVLNSDASDVSEED